MLRQTQANLPGSPPASLREAESVTRAVARPDSGQEPVQRELLRGQPKEDWGQGRMV